MQGFGKVLAANYSSGAPATQGPVFWEGGRGMLVIKATAYPTTTKLQYLSKGGAIDLVTITTDGIYVFDLPAGQYQLFMNAGTATSLYADLVSCRYG